MGTAKIYIGSDEILAWQHLYLIYDPDTDNDGDARTGSGVQIIRGGPSGLGVGDILVEAGVAEASSEDAFGGETAADRNLTELEDGPTATTLWATMVTAAQNLGTYDNVTKTSTMDVAYYGAGLNSAGVIRAVMDAVGRDIDANLPQLGGSGPTMASFKFPGLNSVLRIGADGTYDTTDIAPGLAPTVIYDDGGTDEYIIPSDQLTWIIEDDDTNTDDTITIVGLDSGNASYARRGNDLVIFGDQGGGRPVAIIKDHFGPNGPKLDSIDFDDTTVPTTSLSPAQFAPAPLPSGVPDILSPVGASKSMVSPLIVDLDADGIEATALNTSTTTTFFDLYSNGFAVQTAWVGADDGLLVRDLNENGIIDDASELFGSPTIDGFALLAPLDSNGDLLINASDADWSDLLIWKDANGDAVTQSGELQSLGYHTITSINLAGVTPSTSTVNGNPISHTSTIVKNGSSAAIADVWFVHDHVNTRYDGDYTLDIRALFLPTLRGFGHLPDLQVAMSQDEDLLELVNDFAMNVSLEAFGDNAALNATIEEILLTWAGVEDTTPWTRGSFIVAARLEFLEEFAGQEWRGVGGTANPYENAASQLDIAFGVALHLMKAQLLIQTVGQELFSDPLTYDVWSGEIEGTPTLDEDAIGDLVDLATAPGVDAEEFWLAVTSFIHYVKDIETLTTPEETWLDDAIYASDPSLSWGDIETAFLQSLDYDYQVPITGTSGNDAGGTALHGSYLNDSISGQQGHDELYGYGGSDTLYGDDGNDTLSPGLGGNLVYGGAGNDTFIHSGGSDVYTDTSGTDVIVMPTGIVAGDLSFSRVGNTSLLIHVAGYGTVQLENQINTSPMRFETIQFSDTSTINLSTFSTNLTTYGTAGNDSLIGVILGAGANDTIYGYGGNDTIEGRLGTNVIDGGDGNDTITCDSGNDTIVASAGFDSVSVAGGTDTFLIPVGYDSSDVDMVRLASSPNDLVVTIAGLGQTKFTGHFYLSTLEYIQYASGGSPISVSSLSIATVGSESGDSFSGDVSGASNNDIMFGRGGNDTITAGAGNDIVDGGDGNDVMYTYNGNDIVYFSNGADWILETNNFNTDTIRFRAGVDP